MIIPMSRRAIRATTVIECEYHICLEPDEVKRVPLIPENQNSSSPKTRTPNKLIMKTLRNQAFSQGLFKTVGKFAALTECNEDNWARS